MSAYLNMLTEKRESTYQLGKAILEKAAKENRGLTADEERAHQQTVEDLDAIRSQIDKLAEDTERAREVQDTVRKLGPAPARGNWVSSEDKRLLDDFRSMLLEGNPKPIELHDDQMHGQQLRQSIPGVERRALAEGTPNPGTPWAGVNLYGRILDHMVETSAVMRAGATVITTSTGEPLRLPRSTGYSTATITTEASTISESDPTLSAVDLGAYKWAFLVTLSRELVEDDSIGFLGYLAKQSGVALGLGMGTKFINGSGSGEPRGVLADAGIGVTGPTGTATSLGAQATAGQGTDLLNSLVGSLAAPYAQQRSSAFLLATSSLTTVNNLKTSQGELVGNTFVAQSAQPFYIDPFVPAMAANARSILFGDWSRYYIRVVNGLRFERSDEFRFDTDQVTFRAIIRADASLIDTSSIKVFKNSAT